MADENPKADPETLAAVQILADEAGTDPKRAEQLAKALQAAYAKEGLGILLGTWPVSAGVADQRIARLDQILQELPNSEAPPTPFELGAMFRITPSQAQSLLRTYQARHGARLRELMRSRIAVAANSSKAKGDDFEFVFADKTTLDYAADLLRRRGLSRGLTVDAVALTLRVPKETKKDSQNAQDYLKKIGSGQ